MAWRSELFRLQGGLNKEDPIYTLRPGEATVAKNYEATIASGYQRVDGYERFDGRTSPSTATYTVYSYTVGGPTAIADGDLVTGHTSGATGYACGSCTITSGALATNDAAGQIAITSITGAFTNGERIKVGGVQLATITTPGAAGGIADANRSSWLAGARNHLRGLITTVPGQGAILGVWEYNNVIYAFRRGTGGSAGNIIMHKATASGWSAVTLSSYIQFSTGTGEIFEGDTITGATSGATAVVRRVNIAAGNWAGPTYASGRLCISNIVGTFQNGENLQVAAVTKAVAVGANAVSSFTYNAASRFEFVNHNFYGGSNYNRMYGCDGYNRAFEFDGTYFTFIETGMATDSPNHIEVHRNHLFLSFVGGSLQNSGTGFPLIWSVRSGAAEIGIGDDVTNLIANGANTMLVTARTSVWILEGTSNLDWNLKAVSDSSFGGVPYTAQEVNGATMFLDASQIVTIQATNAYGDWQPVPLSRNVKRVLDSSIALTAKGALSCTKKNQFRIYFADKNALIGTFVGAKLMGWMQATYDHQFVCWVSARDASNVEHLYAGTDDGYVMELDVGSSFDGAAIESVLQLPFNYHGNPDRKKRWRKVTLEMDTPAAVNLRLLTDLDYGAGGLSTTAPYTATPPSGGYWDFASWDEFFWDSAVVSSPEINIDGVGRNIALTFYHSNDVDDAFTIQAVLLNFDVWGQQR